MKQQDQLLSIIKEELIKKSKEKHVEKVIPLLTPDLVQYMIVNDLPIYEDHLKEILFDQSKQTIGTVIDQMEYEKNLRAQQDEMEHQVFLKKTQKRKKKLLALQQNNPELFLKKTQAPEPMTQMHQLQNNFAKLLSNFTQIVAAQVVQEIKQPIRKSKKRAKRPSTPEFDQSVEDKLNNDQFEIIKSNDVMEVKKDEKMKKEINSPTKNIISHNQKIDLKQKTVNKQQQNFEDDLISDDSYSNQDQLNQRVKQFSNIGQQSYLTNNQLNYQDGQQSMSYSQSNTQSKYQKNYDEFETLKQQSQIHNQGIPGSQSIKYPIPEKQIQEQQNYSSGDLESYDDIEPLQNNKSKFQNQQASHFQQSSDDYPDDFIEESNDRFQQNASNFYKPKYQAQAPEQVDFDDDIEDLLL